MASIGVIIPEGPLYPWDFFDKLWKMLLLAFDLLLLVLPSGSIGTTQSANINFLCVSDPTWNPSSKKVVGYTSKSISLPGFDSMEFQMVLPKGWNNEDCCRRVQIRFDSELLGKSLESAVFFPYLEWTPCGVVMKHVVCYGWLSDNKGAGDFWDYGSWWIIVQDCITEGLNEIAHEIVTFGEGANILNPSSPRWGGNLGVEPFSLSGKEPFRLPSAMSAPRRALACLLEGTLHSKQAWLGYLDTINIGTLTSLSYKFEFSLSQPSNAEIFSVYFYTAENLATIERQMQCDNSTAVGHSETTAVNSLKGWGLGDSQKTLTLSISNAWSGCHIENKEGRPTYTCQGGRNFPDGGGTADKPRVLRIGVSSCQYPLRGIPLSYRLEFLNSQGLCPGHAIAVNANQAAQTSPMTSGALSCHPFNQGLSACPLTAIMAILLLHHLTTPNIASHYPA